MTNHRKGLEAALIEDLSACIQAQGGKAIPHATGRESQSDLDVLWKGERYVIELKVSAENRLEHLQGRFASAILEAQKHAGAVGARALPVLGLERLTERTLEVLSLYVEHFAPGLEWGSIDRHGRKHFSGAAWAELIGPGRPRRSEQRVPPVLDVFSDRGQWLSKVMLAQRLPLRVMAAPRGRIHNTRELARMADVSPASVSRWAKRLKQEGFLEVDEHGLRLVRIREFLDRWRKALARPRREVRARWLLPTRDTLQHLVHVLSIHAQGSLRAFEPDKLPAYDGALEWEKGPRACLGMFSASTALSFSFVQAAPVHLYLERITEASLKMLGLQAVSARESADLSVVEPRFPESTYRACVLARGPHAVAVPACDVIQTWLEISTHPARGQEQAGEIERRMIEPLILRETGREHGG